MADVPDNHTPRLPQEIRQSADAVKMAVVGDNLRSDRSAQRIEEVDETMYPVAGFAMRANVRHDTVTERLKAREERVGRLEEKA